MRQRGRRSAAAEEVISVDGRSPPLQPPRYLNKAEKQVFAELAATRHFVPTDSGLLASLAQATVMARRAARDFGGTADMPFCTAHTAFDPKRTPASPSGKAD